MSDKLNIQLRNVIILIIAGILSLNNLAVASSEINSNRYGFNFVAAGDWGCDKKAHETVNHMQNKSPDLVLALGDISYQKDADCHLTTIAIRIKLQNLLLSFRGFSHYYLPENGQNTLVFLVQDTYYIGVEN